MLIRAIFIDFISLKRLDFGLNQALLFTFFKCLSISYFPKYFHGWFVNLLNYSSSLFDFYKFPEIPGEFFGDIEIKLNVLCVDETIVHDFIK